MVLRYFHWILAGIIVILSLIVLNQLDTPKIPKPNSSIRIE